MKKAIAFIGTFGLPMIALAQTADSILIRFKGLIDISIVVIMALALLAFLWGLMMYLFGGAGEKAEEGRKIMIWGIIALFVMVSVWGLVRVLSNTFGVGSGGTAPIPGVAGGGGSGNLNVGYQGSSGGFNINLGN